MSTRKQTTKFQQKSVNVCKSYKFSESTQKNRKYPLLATLRQVTVKCKSQIYLVCVHNILHVLKCTLQNAYVTA